MNQTNRNRSLSCLFIFAALVLRPLTRPGAEEEKPVNAASPYQAWRHSGSFYILTTPDGVDLPATASEDNFPLLVRLDKDFFDFKQAQKVIQTGAHA